MSEYRVLLVDDEEELVSTLVERLEYRGFSASYCTNGQDALKMLREESYNVVVVDLKLPGMSGVDLLQTIRTAYPHLPVLMVTGHGAGGNDGFQPPDGAFAFLVKPINIDELVAKMTEAIKAYEPGQ
ncbi:MAG TPA: response regulator [candidate division Zixibacteria bacterium]|nr:response regulator [candidate division Zixibacteria bacterium]